MNLGHDIAKASPEEFAKLKAEIGYRPPRATLRLVTDEAVEALKRFQDRALK